MLVLASDGEGAIKDGLVDSASCILVEGCSIHADWEHWKRTCVAEGGDYDSAMDLSSRGGRKAVDYRTQRGRGWRSKCRGREEKRAYMPRDLLVSFMLAGLALEQEGALKTGL